MRQVLCLFSYPRGEMRNVLVNKKMWRDWNPNSFVISNSLKPQLAPPKIRQRLSLRKLFFSIPTSNTTNIFMLLKMVSWLFSLPGREGPWIHLRINFHYYTFDCDLNVGMTGLDLRNMFITDWGHVGSYTILRIVFPCFDV